MHTAEIRIDPGQWEGALADTDGHQIVVAGPGTGKTEFLVRRVAHLVSSGLARRDQIVVLCFSRRAAADLRQRMESRISAQGVPVDVTTFHSLALRLLETSGGERPIPLTTPEQVGLVTDLLTEEDPGDWPMTYRGILTSPAFAGEVADFLMRCSERLLTPEDLEERAQRRADWRGLAGLYRRYLGRLHETGRTDYGVLLTQAVALLETEEGRALASRYAYVLVDEYQDTSPAQARMADLLAAPSGNLTVAGDPYESIYSFRGAELRNIDDFTSSHPDASRLILSKSFRVPAEILEAALRVVSPGELPGAAGPVEPAPHRGRVEAYVFDQETAEAEWIAREVEHAIEVDGVALGAIAVLVRSKKELLGELSRALSRRHIPHDAPDTRLVDHPAVRLFADLVTVALLGGAPDETGGVEAAEADRAMRRVLLGPLLRLGLGEERSLIRRRRSTEESWGELLARERPDLEGLASLVSDSAWATTGPAVDGFWHAWSTLEGINDLVSDPERGEWRQTWSAFAQVLARQAERDPKVTLARYFELTGEEDFEATPLLSHQPKEDRVTLTTLHQAKGLEFDIVFIANAVEGVFPDLRRSRRMLRPELLSPERTTDPAAQHLFQLQEEMRLAYTAMTRARLRVAWTATDAGVDQGERRPSRFLVAAAGVSGLGELSPPEEGRQEAVTLAEAEIRLRRDLLDPVVGAAQRLAAVRLLARPPRLWWSALAFAGVAEAGPDAPLISGPLRLSPSQADSYATCPRRYALERRLRLGDADSPYAQFGSLIHATLQRAEGGVVGTGRRHADLDDALRHLEEVWEEADFGTPELTAAWLEKGRELIIKLYENWPAHGGVPVGLEERVATHIDGVRWVGFIDRIEETPRGLRVVDYKTSTNAPTREDAAASIQLGFYAAALNHAGRLVVDAEMWFPRGSAKSVTIRRFAMDNLDTLLEEMARITREIQAENWEPKVGNHCGRCLFLRVCPAWPEGKGAFLP
ncbi:MAG: ATP-dependent helicase [Acidimicrobiia bacterium]